MAHSIAWTWHGRVCGIDSKEGPAVLGVNVYFLVTIRMMPKRHRLSHQSSLTKGCVPDGEFHLINPAGEKLNPVLRYGMNPEEESSVLYELYDRYTESHSSRISSSE